MIVGDKLATAVAVTTLPSFLMQPLFSFLRGERSKFFSINIKVIKAVYKNIINN